jgi:hypothetical protein
MFRLLRSAAFGDTICSQHKRRTENMQKELIEQQKQTGSLQSLLDAEKLRREAAEREASRMADQIERREKEVAELQTALERSHVSQSETDDKLSGARAMIQDLEHQLADLRAFSGRGHGVDRGTVADLEQEVSMRKEAEAECERLRQELHRVASPGPAATAFASGGQNSSNAKEATSATIEPRGLQRQTTESHGQSQGVGTENAVTEELQALRADMQLLLQQQLSQSDEDGKTKQREPPDSRNEEVIKQPQQPQSQSSGKAVPLQACSEEQWRIVPSAPASDCNSSVDFSGENCGADVAKVRNAGIATSNTDATAAATARSIQSRQEVEHILSALEAARRSLDLSATDGPGGLLSAHESSSASRPEFVSRSAPSTPGAAASARRSFGQLYEDEDVRMDRWGPRDGLSESARLAPGRNPLMSLAGHNNRYSMY